MTYKSPSSIRTLLLLLLFVIGPLQAQSVFACSMVNVVMHDACCCVGHSEDEDCADAECEGALPVNASPCCERSVELSLDNDARLDAPVLKPVEVRSTVDHPPAVITIQYDFLLSLPHALVPVFSTSPEFSQSGTDTYLITQRLRI